MSDLQTPETAAPETDETDSAPEVKCEHCGAVRHDTSTVWCGHCGFHPGMGCCIELAEDDREPSEENEEVAAKVPSAAVGLMQLVRAIPAWAWKIAAGVAIVSVISLAPRFFTQPESNARTTWSLCQLTLSIMMIAIAHVGSYLRAVTEGDGLGVMDLLLRPFTVWAPTFRDLKATGTGWYRAGMFSWGTTAKILTLTAVGGIPYDRMWDWGIEEPPKTNLIGAIADAAREGSPTTDGLADAVDNVDDGEGSEDSAKPVKKEPKREMVDCLIVGYTYASLEGKKLGAILVATEIKGKLRYVGKINRGFSLDDLDEILARVKQIPRPRPFIKCRERAQWVQPVMTCRISYVGLTSSKRPKNLEFDKLLGEISL